MPKLQDIHPLLQVGMKVRATYQGNSLRDQIRTIKEVKPTGFASIEGGNWPEMKTNKSTIEILSMPDGSDPPYWYRDVGKEVVVSSDMKGILQGKTNEYGHLFIKPTDPNRGYQDGSYSMSVYTIPSENKKVTASGWTYIDSSKASGILDEETLNRSIEHLRKTTYQNIIPITPRPVGLEEYWFNHTNKKKSLMSNLIKFVKDLAVDADTKLLRKYGMEDECGNPTGEGQDLADLLNYQARRKEIVDYCKAKQEEDKAEKK